VSKEARKIGTFNASMGVRSMITARPIWLAFKFFMLCTALLAVVLGITVLMFVPVFVLYFILPIFVFFTVFTVAIRERDRNFRVREIFRDIFRLGFWR